MYKDTDTCEIKFVNEAKVDKVKGLMQPDDVICRLAETFKVLSDPTRAKIISALMMEELCVCDIAHLLNISDSAVSHQLRTLRNLKLVKFRRGGKMAFYSLNDEHIHKLFQHGLEHVIR